MVYLINDIGKIGQIQGKKARLPSYTIYKNKLKKWIKDLNLRPQTM